MSLFTRSLHSYVLLGAGLFPALLIQALYLQRLVVHKLPPAAVVVSVFLPLGPCGQSAFALVQLARVGTSLYATTGRGVLPGGEMVVAAVTALSTLAAFMLWGLGVWWLALALLTIGRQVLQGGFAFNMCVPSSLVGCPGLTSP
jgi:tellurite resistance protein TehA-like permease